MGVAHKYASCSSCRRIEIMEGYDPVEVQEAKFVDTREGVK